jgi:formylglycine-generating enzyme required for sulfatase activity
MAARKHLPQPFGRFRIVRPLGEGGTGAVYLAEDARLGCLIALKISHFDEQTDLKGLERFRREARVAQSIHHPYVCPVYESGEIDGIHYLTMPFVEGTPLSQMISREEPWEPRRAAELVRRLSLALDAVHRENVIHRDLKPHNIMVKAGDEPVLMDFGLARNTFPLGHRITMTGEAVGTPIYMPPELIKGDPAAIGPASDVYSLGLILYELLTGRPPFSATNIPALFYQILNREPPAPSELRPGLDSALETVCRKALAKRPEERPASMAELASSLEAYLRPGTPAPSERTPGPSERTPIPVQGEEGSRPAQDGGRREPTQLQEEGEAKLTRLLRQSLERTGGKPTAEDRSAANELVRQYHLGRERGRALVREVRAQWEKERSRDSGAGSGAKEWWLGATPLGRERPRTPRSGEVVALLLGKNVEMSFAWIAPGSFLMGSPRSEKQRLDDETQHRVTLTKGFFLGIHPVTQAQWVAILGSNPSRFQGDQRPVENVSWEDCTEFCRLLGERLGKRFRLPGEAEWEYACRAGTATPFSFGETITTDQANFDGNFTYGDGPKGIRREQPTPVGSFPANAWGLYDMHGNVREWCEDWYASYGREDVTDPMPPAAGIARVLRGGAWSDDPKECRSACRSWSEPDSRRGRFGCRICWC